MPLVKPALANVSPGQPVTAQAWNAVLSAIGALYDAVLALGANTVDVTLLDGSTPIADAQVVAVPASGAPIVAVPPRGGGTAFTLTGLTAGAWTIQVNAPGYTAAPTAMTVPSGAVSINLTANTTPMPDVLGRPASDALAALNAAGVQIDLMLDISGAEISKTALPPEKASARVLFQFPTPGTRVAAATAHTRLVLSAELEGAITTVPNVVGMSYFQMIQALNAAGLKLGNLDNG